MDAQDIYPTVISIVLVGMLLGIGILVFENFGDATETVSTVPNESITIASGAGQTDYTDNVDITAFRNYSHNFVEGQDFNVTAAGVISANVSDGTYFADYTGHVDSAATDAMDANVSAIAPIANTWLALIVTVFALSIILGLVIKSFSNQNR